MIDLLLIDTFRELRRIRMDLETRIQLGQRG